MAIKSTSNSSAYIPGVCNINSQEVAKRQLIATVSSIIFVVGLLVLIVVGVNRWFRLLLFPAAFLAISCSLQAKHHFCSGYGGSGKQNASEGSTKPIAVLDETALAKDKRRAIQLHLQSAAIGLLITILSLIIPASR